MAWRLLTSDGAAAAGGLACDEALAQRAGAGLSPPTLRLYTYRAHVALVGRFQDVEHEVHLGSCKAAGVEVNRRPTGGGAILMGPGQLGVALALPGRGDLSALRARGLMQRFSTGLVAGLAELGVRASFRGKNDLEVGGRKIAGLGVCRVPSGGLLFHASLLVDLDTSLMARVLRTPFEKITARELGTLAGRTSTVRAVLGREVALEEVRAHVARGFARSLEVVLERGEPAGLSREESAQIAALERAKYRSADWVFQRTAVPDALGAARLRAGGGLVDVRVALAGRTIKAVHVRGDFIEDEGAVADLEARLRWHRAEEGAVARTIERWAERHAGTLDPAALTRAVLAAVRRAEPAPTAQREPARQPPRAPARQPHGCFVTPGGPRG